MTWIWDMDLGLGFGLGLGNFITSGLIPLHEGWLDDRHYFVDPLGFEHGNLSLHS